MVTKKIPRKHTRTQGPIAMLETILKKKANGLASFPCEIFFIILDWTSMFLAKSGKRSKPLRVQKWTVPVSIDETKTKRQKDNKFPPHSLIFPSSHCTDNHDVASTLARVQYGCRFLTFWCFFFATVSWSHTSPPHLNPVCLAIDVLYV